MREHIVCFLDIIGAYANGADLYMREFSKSLTDRAYTWYVNLKHLVSFFNTKFFCADGRFTLPRLGPTRQYLGEDLHGYVKRFSWEKH